jgi:hypothetical protein
MNFRNVFAVSVAILALTAASPVRANSTAHPSRPASGNGQLCTDTDPTMNPCQSLTDNAVGPNFFETSDGTGLSFFEIFSVSGIEAGTTVNFTFSTAPPAGDFGAFLCDNFVTGAAGSAFSADGKFMSTACTGLDPALGSDISSLVPSVTDPVTRWNFAGNGGVSTWYFFAETTSFTAPSQFLPTSVTLTNGTSMPEPGSLAMLGLGLVGLALLSRRAEAAR